MSLNRLDEERVEKLCKETEADIWIPKEDELWHCTVVFIGALLVPQSYYGLVHYWYRA
jgi:hypothetical protein